MMPILIKSDDVSSGRKAKASQASYSQHSQHRSQCKPVFTHISTFSLARDFIVAKTAFQSQYEVSTENRQISTFRAFILAKRACLRLFEVSGENRHLSPFLLKSPFLVSKSKMATTNFSHWEQN